MDKNDIINELKYQAKQFIYMYPDFDYLLDTYNEIYRTLGFIHKAFEDEDFNNVRLTKIITHKFSDKIYEAAIEDEGDDFSFIEECMEAMAKYILSSLIISSPNKLKYYAQQGFTSTDVALKSNIEQHINDPIDTYNDIYKELIIQANKIQEADKNYKDWELKEIEGVIEDYEIKLLERDYVVNTHVNAKRIYDLYNSLADYTLKLIVSKYGNDFWITLTK